MCFNNFKSQFTRSDSDELPIELAAIADMICFFFGLINRW